VSQTQLDLLLIYNCYMNCTGEATCRWQQPSLVSLNGIDYASYRSTTGNPNPTLKNTCFQSSATSLPKSGPSFVISVHLSTFCSPTVPLPCTTLRFACKRRAGESFGRASVAVDLPFVSRLQFHLDGARGFLVQEAKLGGTIREAVAMNVVEPQIRHVEEG
jgi:hypothetical protein